MGRHVDFFHLHFTGGRNVSSPPPAYTLQPNAHTALPITLLAVPFSPIGAMNLVRMLTQPGTSDRCCAKFFEFVVTAIPMAFCGKRSKERQQAISSADSSSPAGKFVLTRLAMAERVETRAPANVVDIATFDLDSPKRERTLKA